MLAKFLSETFKMAETLSINITDLLIDEGSKVENELQDLIKEYKEIESQVMHYRESLFESMQICEEKVKRAEKMKIAKDLVKGGISIDTVFIVNKLFSYKTTKNLSAFSIN